MKKNWLKQYAQEGKVDYWNELAKAKYGQNMPNMTDEQIAIVRDTNRVTDDPLMIPGSPRVKAQSGTKVSSKGYKKNSPDKNEPMLTIPSNRITMQDVEHPVMAYPSAGNPTFMHPGGEYYFPHADYVTEVPAMAQGGMIKRADGHYSKRGLWDNIRANAGSGKKPTKEMLKQEKKIKASEKAQDGKKLSASDLAKLRQAVANYNPSPYQDMDPAMLQQYRENQRVMQLAATPQGKVQLKKEAEDKKYANKKKQEVAKDKETRKELQEQYARQRFADDPSVINPAYWQTDPQTGRTPQQRLDDMGTDLQTRVFRGGTDVIDNLNPGVWVAGMAGNLAKAPLKAQQENSYTPYLSALGEPLAWGIGEELIAPYVNKAVGKASQKIKDAYSKLNDAVKPPRYSLPMMTDIVPQVSQNIKTNYKDLLKTKQKYQPYGYDLPINPKEIAAYDLETDKTIKDLVNQHNTFTRGVSTNWDHIEKSSPAIIDILKKAGIDYRANPEEAAAYMATHVPGNTGYGRAGMNKDMFNQNLDAIYTSNSEGTAEGYTYGDGYIVKVKKPTDFTSPNRQDWLNNNEIKYHENKRLTPAQQDRFNDIYDDLLLGDEFTKISNKLWNDKYKALEESAENNYLQKQQFQIQRENETIDIIKQKAAVLAGVDKQLGYNLDYKPGDILKTSASRVEINSMPQRMKNAGLSDSEIAKHTDIIRNKQSEIHNKYQPEFDRLFAKRAELNSELFKHSILTGHNDHILPLLSPNNKEAYEIMKEEIENNKKELIKAYGLENNPKLEFYQFGDDEVANEMGNKAVNDFWDEHNDYIQTANEKALSKFKPIQKGLDNNDYIEQGDKIYENVNKEISDFLKINYPAYHNPYAHYIHLGNPGQKIFEPIELKRITPELYKNKSRGHSGKYSKGLSAAALAPLLGAAAMSQQDTKQSGGKLTKNWLQNY